MGINLDFCINTSGQTHPIGDVFMRKTNIVLAFLIFCMLSTGCSETKINSNGSSNVSSGDYTILSKDNDNDFHTSATKISSAQLETIDSGDTYKDIIEKIGKGKDFNQYETVTENYASYIYLVDGKYVFTLSFNSLDDKSTKSGHDYVKQLKPAFPPKELLEYEEKGYLYGVLINEDFVCLGNDGEEFYQFNSKDAKISFLDGKSASKNDLINLDCLFVKVDVIMESSPPQLSCEEIIIIK